MSLKGTIMNYELWIMNEIKKNYNKILLLIVILLLACSGAFSQSFEGTITFVSDIIPSAKMVKMGFTKEMLQGKKNEGGFWSDTARVSYKQGDYYRLTSIKPKVWSVYKSDTHSIYSFQDGENADKCTVEDASNDIIVFFTGKKPVITKLDTTAIVNGITCSIVRVKSKNIESDYYYNPTMLVVNPDLYSKHLKDGLADVLKLTNSIPIKKITTTTTATITETMILIKEEKLDDKLFIIPNLIPDEDNKTKNADNLKYMKIKK